MEPDTRPPSLHDLPRGVRLQAHVSLVLPVDLGVDGDHVSVNDHPCVNTSSVRQGSGSGISLNDP